MSVTKKFPVFLLCLLLVAGVVPGVRVVASDDVEATAFKSIYMNNYDAIGADYNAGYKYVLFCKEGAGYSTSYGIVLSKIPIYVKESSDRYYMCDSTGNYISEGSNYHSYLQDGLKFYSTTLGSFFASNYDICRYDDGTVIFNARNLPDWFSVAYIDVADCPAAIPKCDQLSGFYLNDGYVAYYYYKDYPEYAFCVASDNELYVIREKSDTGEARRFVGRVSDGKIVTSRGTNDVMYVYNRKLGTWSGFGELQTFFYPWGGYSIYGSPLMNLGHTYDSLNDNNNFTLLGSNKAIKQLDFDSSGALVSENDFSAGGAIGGLPSFPKAPAPDLVGAVQTIKWSRTMTEVVGLIPLLLGLVISFLGLRKALRFFSSLLRKA